MPQCVSRAVSALRALLNMRASAYLWRSAPEINHCAMEGKSGLSVGQLVHLRVRTRNICTENGT